MLVDYERAWGELAEHVAEKTQHGREGLLVEMAEIAARCRVPAGELSRLLRLYGVEVERARAISTESAPSDGERFHADSVRGGIDSSGAIIGEGSHDGRITRSNGAGGASNGRRVV